MPSVPHLGFDPRPVAAVVWRLAPCLASAALRCFFALAWSSRVHLPALPSLGPVLLPRPPSGPYTGRNGTNAGSDPRRLAHTGKASLLALLCRPSIRPQTTSWARTSPSHPRRCVRPGVATQASSWDRRTRRTTTRNGFVILRAARSPPAASHPPPAKPCSWTTQLPSATCGVTSHGLDFHLLTKQHRRRTVPACAGRQRRGSCQGHLSTLVLAFAGMTEIVARPHRYTLAH